MADSISESGNFTPDIFSPLQFCEVVEEGQQHQLQLHRHHSQITQQLNPQVQQQTPQTTLQHDQTHQQSQTHHQPQVPAHNNSSQHSQQQSVTLQQEQILQQQPQQSSQQQPPITTQQIIPQASQQNQDGNSHQPQQTSLPAEQTSSIKQETPSQQLLDAQNGVKVFSSMEILFTTPVSNGLSTQSLNVPVVTLQQQPIPQQLYQMQANRQQQQQQIQQLQINSLHLQNNSQIQIEQQLQNAINEATVVGISSVEGFSLPINNNQIASPPATVASQATQTDQTSVDDDEPEIIFSTAAKPSPNTQSSKNIIILNGESQKELKSDVKPIPIKKTWRRPWKKKKEREKRQPVKKARRIKRRRMVITKKSSVNIDPRNGPAIDTSKTLVQRQSQEQINQLKQKRQRIKLNRNSGREYINRLGKIVNARKIGNPCNCPLKCWERMGTKVLDIFNNFWDLCDFNLQNSYLFTCLKLCDVKRRYTKKPAEESRRQNTFEYFVRINGKHFRVCKKAFMSSHGLTSDKRLRTLFSQMKDGALIPEPDKRGKHLRPNKPTSGPLCQNQNNHVEAFTNLTSTKIPSTKSKNRNSKKKLQHQRIDTGKQTMYTPPPHAVGHMHAPPPPPPPAHGTNLQEPPHAYIPNGDIYFPGHYLEPPQAMAPPHINQIPSCQKMLESPAYFMAGMKENTFHQ